MHQKLFFFFELKYAKLSLGGGNPLPDPPSQFSSQITFGDMEMYFISRGARSLIMMNLSETACLTLDIIVLPPSPLLFGGNHNYSSHLCPKLCIRNCFFRAPNAKLSLPLEGDTSLLPDPPPPLPRRLLSETWKYRSFPEALAR